MASGIFGSSSESGEPEAPQEDDALAHADVSTEDAAAEERQESYRADVDDVAQQDRVDEGRLHDRSEGDRGETGGA